MTQPLCAPVPLCKHLPLPGTRADRANAAAGALRAAAADLQDPRLTPVRSLSTARISELVGWLELRAELLGLVSSPPALERNAALAASLATRVPMRPAMTEAAAQILTSLWTSLAGFGLARTDVPLLVQLVCDALVDLDDRRHHNGTAAELARTTGLDQQPVPFDDDADQTFED